MKALLLPVFGPVLGSCSALPPEPDCFDHTFCDKGQACIDEVCVAVDCLSSAECFLGFLCNVETFTCQPGCDSDFDCAASDECVDGECEARMCRDTHLDCPVGFRCNVQTGDCVISENVCIACDRPNDCLDGQECVQFFTDETAWCWDNCASTADCPAGFFCLEDTRDEPQHDPLCFADCAWLNDNLWL